MADSESKDNTIFQIGENEYFSEPPLNSAINVIMDPASEGTVNHVCMRRPIQGKSGPAEALTMGRIAWDQVHGRFFCEYCNNSDMDFEALWEIWNPGDIATA